MSLTPTPDLGSRVAIRRPPAELNMSALVNSVRRTIRKYGLLPRDSRVVVALSGGADSVALLTVLRDLAYSEGFCLAGAAHLNHQLRGAASDADEGFCRRVAADLGVSLYVEKSSVGARARTAGISVEHAAHDARNEFYKRAAADAAASFVAVAHTKDDQAETFLLRLLRGAGPRGLGGMHPRSGIVVRPFIETARADVREFLATRGIPFQDDATNADTTIPRNRIRHELMPFLEARFTSGIADVLAREAAIAREDAEYLDAVAAATAERMWSRSSAGVEMPIDDLLALPAAIARRVIRRAQEVAGGGRFVGFDAVDTVMRLAVSKSMGPLDLPGHRVNRRGDTLVLTRSAGRHTRPGAVAFSYELRVPGTVRVPEAACAISADVGAVPEGQSAAHLWRLAGRSDEAVIEAGRVAGPLSVRNRRPGDRLRPLGLKGHKKLQDLFVDAKVARADRETTPVIVDSAGQIVWVAGHALAEQFRVTDRTKAVVILKRIPI
jgi:tRNA(Ile)-lysidine synthase